MTMNLHPCERIYALSQKPVYGDVPGICRITGKESTGMLFEKWVRPTFNDHDSLGPGIIISNEALFCFDEASEEIQRKTGRDKKQRFRTYSHIINNGEWHCMTKANKKEIFEMVCDDAELVCLTDTGQKHNLFKHRSGMWQLDDLHIAPNIHDLKLLHKTMQNLLDVGFTQTAVINGDYNSAFIIRNGVDVWRENELVLRKYRGQALFDFTAWMLFTNK